jgi:hypothetical protein
MAACDVLYNDPAHAGQVRRDPAGQPLGPPGDGWRPCPAHGNVWTDPELVLRFICTDHRRQVAALHAAGLASRVRWNRPGLPVAPAPSASGGEGP